MRELSGSVQELPRRVRELPRTGTDPTGSKQQGPWEIHNGTNIERLELILVYVGSRIRGRVPARERPGKVRKWSGSWHDNFFEI